MHELSLMKSLIGQVKRIAETEGGGKVTRIDVSLGPLSGVDTHLLQNAFGRLAPQSVVCDAELLIQHVALRALCRQCSCDFEVESFRFQCPACHSPRVQVISGDGFRLLSIELEEYESESPRLEFSNR